MRSLALLATLVAATGSACLGVRPRLAPPALEAGVPRTLAKWRAAHYRDVRYALDLTLAPGEERLQGREEMAVTLGAGAGDLVLDWRVAGKAGPADPRVAGIKANGRPVDDARFALEHLVIPRAHLREGRNTIELRFESRIRTAGTAVTRYLDREDGSEYLYSLFVPSDASTTFPCFDQPDLKARYTLTVTAPAAWTVVSNAPAQQVTAGEGVRVWRFAETTPQSTYHFAFAAGPFVELADPASAHGTRLFVRKSRAARAQKELAEVFRLTRGGLAFLEGYFSHRFPFPKYDLILVPEFPYGGMEHAGATFLREEAILFPSDPTAADLLSRAEVMMHEAAHQWFGDLVTMRWFDDLWLKEGFATFMAYKAVEALLPGFDAWKSFYLRLKPLAYATDVTQGTTPIFQEIHNLSAAKSAYGNIVYRKAPSILRQAEFHLGAQAFQEAIRLFVREHAYAAATWEELVRAFERTSGRKLAAWAAAWVKRRGTPDVRVRWSASATGVIDHFELEERDVLGEGGSWPMSVRILLAAPSADDRREVLDVTLGGAGVTPVPQAIAKRRPDLVFANFEDYGYGRFFLDDASRAWALRHFASIQDGFLRALLWGALWDAVREAELAPLEFLSLVVREAPAERDDVVLASVLGRAQEAFGRYLSEAQRLAFEPELVRALDAGMSGAKSAGERITYFRAFREVARGQPARDALLAILRGEKTVPGMTLRTRDRFEIVRALMAAGDKRAPALLEKLREEERSDDARRYAYATGAAWPGEATKQRYFGQYLGDKTIAESWIEASLAPFHSPGQAALALPFLEIALAELPALKRTRKIFFINGWLAAFVGGQCSERAAAAVRTFLARTPALDRDLRLKVLEAADGLERCVRIQAKYASGR